MTKTNPDLYLIALRESSNVPVPILPTLCKLPCFGRISLTSSLPSVNQDFVSSQDKILHLVPVENGQEFPKAGYI